MINDTNTASRIRLGVNIDHIATVRNARGGREPQPLAAAYAAVDGGADGITAHLREDRRHIRDHDITLLRDCLSVPLNLEMAATDAMVTIASAIVPYECCIVPERRQELTTEGGLDVAADTARMTDIIARLHAHGILVSLFIDADERQVDAATEAGADCIELHTGVYADAADDVRREQALATLSTAAQRAANAGLRVHAGHGLNYHNIAPILRLPQLLTVNIGHAIVAHALFVGMTAAVRRMRALIDQYD